MWDKVLQLMAVSCRHGHLSQPFPVLSTRRNDARHSEWESVTSDDSGNLAWVDAQGRDCVLHQEADGARISVSCAN